MSRESQKMECLLGETGVAGSIPFRQICSSEAAIRSNLLFNGLSKNRA
jgi:hypothetical protein